MSTDPDLVLHHATAVDADGVRPDTWIACVAGRIAAVGEGDSWRSHAGTATVVDLADRHLTPGFVELHCHGGGGHRFDDGAEAIEHGLACHRRHGTTRSLVSLVTNRIDRTCANLAAVADLAERDPSVLGSHLEGPFISPRRLGAHDARHVRAPDAATVEQLLAAARGTLRQITIAPELPGADDAIDRFLAAGVIVAVGHTDADHGAARAAFERGARLLTHAFNAMQPVHHRAPGPVAAALDDERVVLELIADGIHVHPSVLRMVLHAAPRRTALITDAMSAACCGDGSYQLGGVEVHVHDGRATRADNGVLAGSTITLDVALRTIVAAGIHPAVAVGALTATPARVLGLDQHLGHLRVGHLADLVVLDQHWQVEHVYTSPERPA